MKKSIFDLVKALLPLKKEQKKQLSFFEKHLGREQYKDLKYLLRLRRVGLYTESSGAPPDCSERTRYAQVNTLVEDEDVVDFVANVNNEVKESFMLDLFNKFSEKAEEYIVEAIAPNIVGLEFVKRAVALQLFAKEPVHVLLLGDPGTGKTEILRSVERTAPISSFGLGSGTSGVGLSVTVSGDEVTKGLLPRADGGICCIDELNLLKKKDRASLYSAMEEGIVTYDKGKTHKEFDAEVRVLATANPDGDRFIGDKVEILKKQLPFDSALLSRFHLVFMIRKPGKKKFSEITKKIVSNSEKEVSDDRTEFISDYVKYAESLEVTFDKKYEPMVVNFVEDAKEDEENFLTEVNPRLVVGIIRLAKASARMNLRREVNQGDVERALKLLKKSLYISEEEEKEGEKTE